MAKEPNSNRAASSSGSGQYLTFSLHAQTYAMDASAVREIIQYVAMTRVPLMPEFVCGVINLRGSVVPVIDLQSRIHRGASEPGKKTCIIIFDVHREGERAEIGLLVESVSEVSTIANADIEPAPQFGGGLRRDYIRGMTKLKDRFVIILDTDKALDIDEMAGLVEKLQASAPT